MNPLIQQLTANAPVLVDGAWGTEFQKLGVVAGECSDVWNLEHPERVEAVARSYVDAGSRVILTNTFRANRLALANYGLASRVAEINRAGVEISQRAANGKAYVFGLLGPSGKLLLMNEVSEGQLRAAFEEQARALAASGPDGLAIETMSDLAEAKLAVAAACATGLPVLACMSFDSGRNKDRTMMGCTPEQAARELTAAGADVVGANCGQGTEGYAAICRRMRRVTDRPLWIQPNAGLPELAGGRVVYKVTTEQFAAAGPELVRAGASFVGGCCGTNPEFIRALGRALAAREGSDLACA
jgi:5-methyltetrahydrofolate--homocysteine methyltransferase